MNNSLRIVRMSSLAGLAGLACWGLVHASWAPEAAHAAAAAGTAGEAESEAAEAAPDPLAPHIAVALHRAGLQPEALAAAGVSPSIVPQVVLAFKGAWADSSLPGYDAAFAEARRLLDDLRRRVEAGVATAEEIAAVPPASVAHAEAAANRETALAALFQAATAVLPAANGETLTVIRANREQWDQPWPYLVTSLSQPERVELREALANERIALSSEEQPDADCAAFLQGVRARPEVAAASASLAATLDAVAAAWQSAVLAVPPQE